MSTKRVIKIRSQFKDGFLKSFELVSVTPEFNTYENYRGWRLSAYCGYSLYVDDTLWIDTDRQQNTKYDTRLKVSRDTYKKYLKDWNNDPDIAVIDIGNKIIGEL